MKKAFTGADIVVIPAGIPRKESRRKHCGANMRLTLL